MNLQAKIEGKKVTKIHKENDKIIINLSINPISKKEIGNVVMTYDNFYGYQVYYYPINENCTDQKINSGRILLYRKEIPKCSNKCAYHTQDNECTNIPN